MKYAKLENQIKHKPGDFCKICVNPVYYFKGEIYKRDKSQFIICPYCNNEIQII